MPTDGLAAAVATLPENSQGHYFDALDSTQNRALADARAGAPSRSLYVADFQRAGRGREGRSWLAAPGAALMASIVFRERTTTPVPWRWTSLAAVSLVEAIGEVRPIVRPAIKWPNDVVLAERKLAGILAETTWDGRELVAVVGIGVNVTAHPLDTGSGGRGAISLGPDVDRGRSLLAFVGRVDAWLAASAEDLFGAWESRLWGRGQRIRMLDVGGEEEVVVLGVEADGSLRVRHANGTERTTTTGELII